MNRDINYNLDSDSGDDMNRTRELDRARAALSHDLGSDKSESESIMSSNSSHSRRSKPTRRVDNDGIVRMERQRDMGYDEDQEQSEIEEEEQSEYAGSELSEGEVLKKKRAALSKLGRLSKRMGVAPYRNFNMDSDLIDMQAEISSLKSEGQLSSNTKLAATILSYTVKGIEMVNNTVDPLGVDLDGWGENVDKDIQSGQFEDVLEDLSEKYGIHIETGPELTLLKMLGISAFTFHASKMFMGKEREDYKRLKAEEAARNQLSAPQETRKVQQPQKQEPPTPKYVPIMTPRPKVPRQEMKGPQGVDEMLKELVIEVDASFEDDDEDDNVQQTQGGLTFDV